MESLYHVLVILRDKYFFQMIYYFVMNGFASIKKKSTQTVIWSSNSESNLQSKCLFIE
jgi:hypothetical protein